MDLNASDITALIAGAAALVTAIGTSIAGIIIAVGTNRKVAAQHALVQEVAKTTDKIEGHVNSAASASAERINALEQQILLLTQSVQDQRQIAQTLATATANHNLVQAAQTGVVADTPSVVRSPILVMPQPNE